jgi:phosphopantetheinyl transferase
MFMDAHVAVDLYLCEVTPLSVLAGRTYLSDAEAQRAKRYRNESDTACSIVAHGLKRRQVSLALGLRADQLHFSALPQGKPVVDMPSPVFFSLAHSGSWVALALSRQCDVGVDIEPVDREFDGKLYAHALNDDERDWVEKADDPKLAFLFCWTQKESVLKALGEPMAYQPKGVTCTPRTGANRATCGSAQVHVFSMIENGCVISIASTRQAGIVRLTECEPCELGSERGSENHGRPAV